MEPKQNATIAQPSYIVTSNLLRKIRILKSSPGLTINDNDRVFCEETLEEMKSFFTRYFPNTQLYFINTENLGDEIFAESTKKYPVIKDSMLLSTCSEFTEIHNGSSLQINRIYGLDGEMLGVGPRPGFSSLNDQIEKLLMSMRGNSLILFEDGTFTGSTLIHVIKKFKDSHAKVDAIVLGFAFPDAIKKIQEVFDGEIIEMKNRLENIIDWMPDHDFFPFLPNCGRVVGHKWGETIFPFYSHDNATFCFPYIRPFVTRNMMQSWTGIPLLYCDEFSMYCLKKTYDLFQRIEKELGEKVSIKHLLKTTPRVSIPLSVNQKRLPKSSGLVLDFLNDCLHW